MSRADGNMSPNHDNHGRFVSGHKAATNKSKNKLTRELFNFMVDGAYTLDAGHFLVDLVGDETVPVKERRAAAEFMIKHFTVSADKLEDADLVEKAAMSKTDLIGSILNKD